jgi:hypothetical protein
VDPQTDILFLRLYRILDRLRLRNPTTSEERLEWASIRESIQAHAMKSEKDLFENQIGQITDIFGEDPQDHTKLLPVLLPYYESEGVLGPQLRSPLVFQIPFMSWKQANELHKHKMKRVRELLAEEKFDSAIWYWERPYRLSQLMMWVDREQISLGHLRDLLPHVWIDAEFPYQFGIGRARRLFIKAGFVTDIEGGIVLPSSFTVYRGCLARHAKGMSWTRSAAKAAWFAGRLDIKGNVYSTIATPDMVLGVFNGRGEQEVILDPKKIKEVTLLEQEVTPKRERIDHG